MEKAPPDCWDRRTALMPTKVIFCVHGVISPLLSNIYLTRVDEMLERAKEATRNGTYTYVKYARFADDLVLLIYAHPRHVWLLGAVTRRLREDPLFSGIFPPLPGFRLPVIGAPITWPIRSASACP